MTSTSAEASTWISSPASDILYDGHDVVPLSRPTRTFVRFIGVYTAMSSSALVDGEEIRVQRSTRFILVESPLRVLPPVTCPCLSTSSMVRRLVLPLALRL